MATLTIDRYKAQGFKTSIHWKGEPQPCPSKRVNGRALETVVWDTVTSPFRQPGLLLQEMEKLTQPDLTARAALEE